MTPPPPSREAAPAEARTRWCSRGDTIATSLTDGRTMTATVPTPESCAEANHLIATGRWRLYQCGQCGKLVEGCTCQ
jgi:hypothetical protein